MEKKQKKKTMRRRRGEERKLKKKNSKNNKKKMKQKNFRDCIVGNSIDSDIPRGGYKIELMEHFCFILSLSLSLSLSLLHTHTRAGHRVMAQNSDIARFLSRSLARL